MELPAEGPLNNAEAATQSNGDETTLDVPIDGSSEDPDIGQYWEISNGKDSIYTQVVEKDHFMVQFSEPNEIGDAYRLNNLKLEVCLKSAGITTNCCWQKSSKLYFLNRKHF